ncbi:unnamed protein product, partial [marine sediment metagenome]
MGFIYCGGSTYKKAVKLDTSDFSQDAETHLYGTINGMSNLSDELLIGGAVTGALERFWRVDTSDMSLIGASALIGETIYDFANDGTYLYVAGKSKIWKLALS